MSEFQIGKLEQLMFRGARNEWEAAELVYLKLLYRLTAKKSRSIATYFDPL